MNLLFSNKVTSKIAQRIIERSAKLGIDADWFMFLSDFESGLDAWRENPYGCISWIQFCPDYPGGDYKTIKGKRYYFSNLKNYTALQLLDLSFDYLEEQQSIHGKFEDVYDLYFSILWPAAIGQSDDYIIKTSSNPIFDINKNNIITKGEVKQYLANRVKERVPQAYWASVLKKKTFCSFIKEKLLLAA